MIKSIRKYHNKIVACRIILVHILPMDFPMFFLDFVGNRILMAVIASVHVIINHPFAVGAYPLVLLLEWWGHKTGLADWDQLARKITFVLFIITTTVGALTGVGIWLTAALISPFGIGSLLRVFFWIWFTEWTIFVGEVVLIMIYFLTWKRWADGIMKKVHMAVGALLSVFSWLTMVIIVAILGFMMGSGAWLEQRTLFSAIANPIYIPQLAFRTTFALMTAGLFAWFTLFFFTQKGSDFRRRAVRFVSGWILCWTIPFVAASIWYWNVVPVIMQANINVGLLTMRFSQWYQTLAYLMAAAVIFIALTAIVGILRPKIIPGLFLILPFVLGIWLLGHFERVREFIRKPYVVADYMYSNGVRVSELPIFQRDGILPYSTYVSHRTVTDDNMVDAGRDVFVMACSRCHTTAGINGVVRRFTNLYGKDTLDAGTMKLFIKTMHNTRTFMPPFPGNEKEMEALTAYIKKLQFDYEPIFNAQTDWTVKADTAGVAP